MEQYLVDVKKSAQKELNDIRKSGDKASINKIERIFLDLESHPKTGVGNPEQLKHNLNEFWSRRINQKDRLVYSIDEQKVTVLVVSAKGHYFDK